MALGRAEMDWARTSHVLALMVNMNRDPKKSRPVKPEDFNPFANTRRKRKPKPIQTINVKDAKGLLMKAFKSSSRKEHGKGPSARDTADQ